MAQTGTKQMNLTGLAATVAVSVLLILFSFRFLDARLTLLAARLLVKSNLQDAMAGIPDILFLIVLSATIFSWALFLLSSRKSIRTFPRSFFLSLGLTLPLSFLMKDYLKYIFGRPLPSLWLYQPDSFGFHWFYGAPFNSFPSGHMAVFTAIALCLGRCGPRFKKAATGFLILLGLALLFTNRHFLSDVIAGFLVGVLSDRITQAIVKWWTFSSKNTNKMD